MKHLKSYQIFESHDTINDFKDILLELSDQNFNVRVKEGDHHAYSECVEIVISKDGGDFDFWTERNIGELTPFRFGDVKDYLIRVLSYASSEWSQFGFWYDYNFDIVTTEQLKPINIKSGHYGYNSKSFNDGTYKTPISINGDEIVHQYHDYQKREDVNIPIADDVKILCVYIGLGK